jgi:hypothetical protein
MRGQHLTLNPREETKLVAIDQFPLRPRAKQARQILKCSDVRSQCLPQIACRLNTAEGRCLVRIRQVRENRLGKEITIGGDGRFVELHTREIHVNAVEAEAEQRNPHSADDSNQCRTRGRFEAFLELRKEDSSLRTAWDNAENIYVRLG